EVRQPLRHRVDVRANHRADAARDSADRAGAPRRAAFRAVAPGGRLRARCSNNEGTSSHMADTGRLNNIIRAWEQGRPAFGSFAHADPQTAIEFSSAPYDGIIFEMEHNPFDV